MTRTIYRNGRTLPKNKHGYEALDGTTSQTGRRSPKSYWNKPMSRRNAGWSSPEAMALSELEIHNEIRDFEKKAMRVYSKQEEGTKGHKCLTDWYNRHGEKGVAFAVFKKKISPLYRERKARIRMGKWPPGFRVR